MNDSVIMSSWHVVNNLLTSLCIMMIMGDVNSDKYERLKLIGQTDLNCALFECERARCVTFVIYEFFQLFDGLMRFLLCYSIICHELEDLNWLRQRDTWNML